MQNLDEIKASILDIIDNLMLVNSIDKLDSGEHFFSSNIQMKPRDLLLLIIELETIYKTKLSENELLNKQIFYLDGLAKLFAKKLNYTIC